MIKPIVILGPTASGKTTLAVQLADAIGGEIISADSRQVYRGMDIGTGKDLREYIVNGVPIKYHLIDIAEPGQKYDIYNYKKDYEIVLDDVIKRGKVPVICGGSGMYLDVALGLYDLKDVEVNMEFRKSIELKSDSELINELKELKIVHNTTDLNDRQRLIRALEIAKFSQNDKSVKSEGYDNEPITDLIFGIDVSREVIRQRITDRLINRLNEGMLEEVKQLHEDGISYEDLYYYGLEYRYISLYISGRITYEQMFSDLNTAIHQFAKRQMTWFRRMEKRGVNIMWVENDVKSILERLK